MNVHSVYIFNKLTLDLSGRTLYSLHSSSCHSNSNSALCDVAIKFKLQLSTKRMPLIQSQILHSPGLYSFPPDSTLKIFARQKKYSTHTVTVHTDSEYCCIIGSNWHFDICVHEMPGQWVARRAMLMLVHLLFQVSAWASRCTCVTVCVCSCVILKQPLVRCP